MKKLLFTWGIMAVIILTSILSGPSAFTAVPHTINYQGMLTDAGGTPLNGYHHLIFRIYDDATGGTLLWCDSIYTVVDHGLVNLILGGLFEPLNLTFDRPYWLEVSVDYEAMPRIQLTSVGYAYRAAVADSAVVAIPSGSFTQIRAEGTVTAGSSATLVIPHYILWTLQLACGQPTAGGVCFVQGFENDRFIAVTYMKYNGDGTSAVGGAEGSENSAITLVSFGSGSYLYSVMCPEEVDGDHNIVLTAAGVELRYRLIY